ncbi:MFS general substrate transporter [Microthyrium microscopicum]|uniref:MFS general substrate transporter n=1 Tax=Microthyrium microscopicum TaxID=703497 RepID=A0A6A6U151_9PEZI|nr:MFS general substrate transporter [Microthyrium microscopicum]
MTPPITGILSFLPVGVGTLLLVVVFGLYFLLFSMGVGIKQHVPEVDAARSSPKETKLIGKDVIESSDEVDMEPSVVKEKDSESNEDHSLPTFSGSPNDAAIYPEGGLRAWLVVLGSFSGMLASFGFMNTIGVFQEYISRNQLSTYSDSTIGWIFSMYIFIAFGGGLIIGPVFDAKGPRLLLLSGSICLVTAMLLIGIASTYWQFMLIIGIIAGAGSSLIFTPSVAAVGHYFHAKRGAATGIAATGGSVGGVIFPLMLQKLFPMLGFAWATRVLALIFAVLTAIAVVLVSSRLPPRPGQSIMPDLMIYRKPAFALATLGVFMHEWGLFIPITYISSFIIATGTTSASSSFPFTLIAALNAGSTFGRCLPGIMADKLGRFNSMIIMLSLCMATTLGLWLPDAILPSSSAAVKPLAVAYAALFGFASGSNISLTPVCIGQLCETEEYGRYYATCYTVVALGSLTGIPIAGALLEAAGGRYWGMALFTGLCYVVSFLAFIWARWYKAGFSSAVF